MGSAKTQPLTQPPAAATTDSTAWLTHLYAELHAMARRCFKGERSSHTLQPTALVHEALMRLAKRGGPDRVDPSDRGTLALAAVVMRHVLVDHARRRRTRKGSEAQRELLLPAPAEGEQSGTAIGVLILDDMLHRLSHLDARAARVIELRFFGGFTVAETANLLGVSVSTVESDSRFALAWMRRDMTPAG